MSKLPSQSIQKFKVTLPSNDKIIECRPYTVKEEKFLMMAGETEDGEKIQHALVNLIDSVITTEGINARDLAPFDINWVFLQARMRSVGEVTDVEYTYKDCEVFSGGCQKSLTINLEEIEVKKKETHNKKIKLDDNLWIEMGYTSMNKIENLKTLPKKATDTERFFQIIYSSVEKIYTNEDVWIAGKDMSNEDIEEFINSLSGKSMRKIYKFMDSTPTISHEVEIKCMEPDCNHIITKDFNNILDFFI